MFCSCVGLCGSFAVDVLCSAPGVAALTCRDKGGVVSDDVVWDEVVCFGGGCFVAPMAEWVAFE